MSGRRVRGRGGSNTKNGQTPATTIVEEVVVLVQP